jgi:putative ABC transport system ATP-binding protein
MDELIRLQDLRKRYETAGGVSTEVLKGLDLGIGRGEFVAIMGASGSGKSTLMNIIGCLDSPSAGAYFLEGRDVAKLSPGQLADLRNRSLGFVFQGFNLLPRMSALDNVALPLLYAGIGRAERRRRAGQAMARLGLEAFGERRPNQLSGGQQQRIAIARALINRPRLILADEPTGNLDTETSREVMAVFRDLNEKDGITLVLVTHEADIAAYARRLIRLVDGRVVEDAPVAQVFPELAPC